MRIPSISSYIIALTLVTSITHAEYKSVGELAQFNQFKQPEYYPYNISNKDEFFQATRQGVVWHLLIKNHKTIDYKNRFCFRHYGCFNDVYGNKEILESDKYEGRANTGDAKIVGKSVIKILQTDYSLGSDKIDISARSISEDLIIIALLNSTDYANHSTLKSAISKRINRLKDRLKRDENLYQYDETMRKSIVLVHEKNTREVTSYLNFLEDYNKLWSEIAQKKYSQSQYRAEKIVQDNLNACKSTSKYKFYQATDNIVSLKNSIKLGKISNEWAKQNYDYASIRETNANINMARLVISSSFETYKRLGGKANNYKQVTRAVNPCQ